MKRFFTSVCFILIIATVLSSCAFWDTTDVNSDTDVDSGTDGVINYPTYDSESTIETEEKRVYALDGTNILDYTLILPGTFSPDAYSFANEIILAVEKLTGERMKIKFDSTPESGKEIVIGNTKRAASSEYASDAETSGYVVKGFGNGNLVILFNNDMGKSEAMNRFTCMLDRGTVDLIEEASMIVSSIGYLRDPFILVDDGVYYAYGTGWKCFRNISGKLDGPWAYVGVVSVIPEDAETNYWAPEVFKIDGEYYMFTTYKSKTSGHRGCVIMKSSSPTGPFTMITDGHITPKDWDSIDGTYYVDEEGQPWMIFVHEWTSTDDGVGRMAAAKLSDDLTHFISEPIELFRADDPNWSRSMVTDGCWMHKCQNGELLMLWSSSDSHGYCVGVARSDNGKVDGKWSHDSELLYSRAITNEYDGGHGMIFKSLNGQTYLSVHSPNTGDSRVC